ncbi:MAG: hypothetical protein GDA48_14275 [Hormoscilla sp. GM102CHS1]|nr:hypothetical protein [Hormoscilla sp. GM102CHS1]
MTNCRVGIAHLIIHHLATMGSVPGKKNIQPLLAVDLRHPQDLDRSGLLAQPTEGSTDP